MNKHKKSFSLVETTLYIAIVSVFLVAATTFLYRVLSVWSSYSAQNEVIDTLYFINKKLSGDIKNAKSVITSNSSEINIYSSNTEREEVKYVLDKGIIKFGIKGGNGCNYENMCPLNSNLVEVTEFTISSLEGFSSGVNNVLVSYNIKLKYFPEGRNSKFEYTESLSNTVIISSL